LVVVAEDGVGIVIGTILALRVSRPSLSILRRRGSRGSDVATATLAAGSSRDEGTGVCEVALSLVRRSFVPGAPIASAVKNLSRASVVLVSALITVGDALAGVLDVDASARAAHLMCDKVTIIEAATLVIRGA
jgi:hypothetical protein